MIKRRQIYELNFLEWLTTLRYSFTHLNPFHQMRNPVMFIVYLGAILTSIETISLSNAGLSFSFQAAISASLWLTILFANFAESYAERRGKAQADTLKNARRNIQAQRLKSRRDLGSFDLVPAYELRQDDLFLVKAGDFIPADGQIIEGIASVDESAITGESAPVIRESGGDRDAVTGGTRLLSDWIIVRVTASSGESYLDKMIAMVEGTRRKKTPNEIALSVLLATMTLLFLLSCATLFPFSLFSVAHTSSGQSIDITSLVALLVCLAPTTIGGLLSPIGIAGMNRLMRANIIATSGHAVEIAGDVDILLLDKTGTITLGNRQATAFIPAQGINPTDLVEASLLASLADRTPEGKSIIALAKELYGIEAEKQEGDIVTIPFSAETRVSGVTIGERAILKGAGDAIEVYVTKLGGHIPADITQRIEIISRQGGTPLTVTDGPRILGVIHLKDVIKSGMKERLMTLRSMGIKSVMVTGDNPLTAAAIASEVGVDDFLAQATPKDKLEYIRRMQKKGNVIAMIGDGTNDAPALAQSDVALVMNSGTQAAKEASNMVDLDSDPTKLIEIVKIGKQLLMTRGALTTFSFANDIAKYFAVIAAVFVTTYPPLEKLNVLYLSSPENALLSTVLFNAFTIMALAPLALRGVSYHVMPTEQVLRRNLLVFGFGGLVLSLISIKLIDMILTFAGGGFT